LINALKLIIRVPDFLVS